MTMIADEGRVVIQAKPLTSQLDGEKDAKLTVPARIDDLNGFLDAVHQEPFKEEDGAVNLDPGIEVDEAFAKVGKDTISMLLKPENKQKLQAILKHHVVSGKVMSSTAVKLSEAPTLNGTKLPLKFDAKAKKLHVGAGTVVAADIEAKNGVIHVVDTVLLPK